jgi:hypothetical protein
MIARLGDAPHQQDRVSSGVTLSVQIAHICAMTGGSLMRRPTLRTAGRCTSNADRWRSMMVAGEPGDMATTRCQAMVSSRGRGPQTDLLWLPGREGGPARVVPCQVRSSRRLSSSLRKMSL